MSYSAKETFENGFNCEQCDTEDEDFQCTCKKQCGRGICKGAA